MVKTKVFWTMKNKGLFSGKGNRRHRRSRRQGTQGMREGLGRVGGLDGCMEDRRRVYIYTSKSSDKKLQLNVDVINVM